MPTVDIRWHQRFSNFKLAFLQLNSAVQLSNTKKLSDLEKQGLIKAFEFTHELAWNVLKDYFEHQGSPGITGSRDAAREAFQKGLISNGKIWMDMIKSRNQSSHTYDKATADEIVEKIQTEYFSAFEAFQITMQRHMEST
jgi:nucleotidyltransferase substrate binding protein (TIGR01987 family)